MKERLTFEGNFCDIAQCRELPCPHNGACSQRKVWERLKAYEDTGLTPERCAEFARADAEGRYIVMRDAEQEGVARLRELAEADKDGRLVVLPCKVGGELYSTLDDIGRLHQCRATYALIDERPYLNTIVLKPVDYEGSQYGASFGAFGKTVFFTREEAEKVLEAMKDE